MWTRAISPYSVRLVSWSIGKSTGTVLFVSTEKAARGRPLGGPSGRKDPVILGPPSRARQGEGGGGFRGHRRRKLFPVRGGTRWTQVARQDETILASMGSA